ncbi:MAG: hypothetical protein IJ660_01340 [Alphaproteobacteria bacterium]|nr:hypothetical protein [Alphaproteobacteria bacterium]
MQKNNWTFKDKLEITESIFTIIVSVMAIWGTLIAWENGFWHKLERVTDHLHHEIAANKDIQSFDDKAASMVKGIKKIM